MNVFFSCSFFYILQKLNMVWISFSKKQLNIKSYSNIKNIFKLYYSWINYYLNGENYKNDKDLL